MKRLSRFLHGWHREFAAAAAVFGLGSALATVPVVVGQYSPAQYSPAQYSPAQYSPAQYSPEAPPAPPQPPAPPAPPGPPAPPPSAAPPVQPLAPACEDWLVVFAPTPVYSATDTVLEEPVWEAQPGEAYRVQLVEAGYALAVLEADAASPGDDSPVWFLIEGDPLGIEGARVCA